MNKHEFTRDNINSTYCWDNVSVTVKNGGGYLNEIKMAYSAVTELASFSGDSADQWTIASGM